MKKESKPKDIHAIISELKRKNSNSKREKINVELAPEDYWSRVELIEKLRLSSGTVSALFSSYDIPKYFGGDKNLTLYAKKTDILNLLEHCHFDGKFQFKRVSYDSSRNLNEKDYKATMRRTKEGELIDEFGLPVPFDSKGNPLHLLTYANEKLDDMPVLYSTQEFSLLIEEVVGINMYRERLVRFFRTGKFRHYKLLGSYFVSENDILINMQRVEQLKGNMKKRFVLTSDLNPDIFPDETKEEK